MARLHLLAPFPTPVIGKRTGAGAWRQHRANSVTASAHSEAARRCWTPQAQQLDMAKRPSSLQVMQVMLVIQLGCDFGDDVPCNLLGSACRLLFWPDLVHPPVNPHR